MRTALHIRLRPMSTEDIPQVVEVERESFPTIWPQTAYRRELQNKLAHYLVITEPPGTEAGTAPAPGVWGALRRLIGTPPPPPEDLIGFIGVWMMAGEAHIVTVAVRERYRRMGVGERLLIACIELAMESGQEVMTLEVRKSNDAAQLLYAKYGFERVGLRVRYYTDNNEDAVLMTTPDLASSSYRALFGRRRAEHKARNPDLWR